MTLTRFILSTAVAFVSTTTLGACAAYAGGFALRDQSAIGTGLSFAGSGTDTYGLSGMFWNPAAVNTVEHFGTSANFTFIAPYAKMTAQPATHENLWGSNSSGNIGIAALVPGSYGAYRLNPDWAVGVAITAPFGLATKARTPWKGMGLAVTGKNMMVNGDIVLGYRVNDWLSIAAGPSIMYGKARFVRNVLPTSKNNFFWGSAHDLDDWGFGFVVGATFKPWQGGEIALGYRSAVKLNLKGTLDAQVLSFIKGGHDTSPASLKMTLPDMLTLGLSQELTPQWTALASVEWKNWSRVQTLHLMTSDDFLARNGQAGLGHNPENIPFKFRDGWNLALGAEYRWDEALTLRGGLAYEISPVDDSNRLPVLPDGNRFWVSAGASYAFNDRLSVDFGYSHAFVKNGSLRQLINDNPIYHKEATLPFVAKVESRVDIVSLGLRYKFGGDAVQQMPDAVLKP